MANATATVSDYDVDILLWSEQQADLLRRRAAGERINDADLDWPNLAEEIESVGREELHAVESFLVQALVYNLKAEAFPASREVSSWRGEARRFRDDAIARFTPAMRQKIDMATIWRRALRALPETIDAAATSTMPSVAGGHARRGLKF